MNTLPSWILIGSLIVAGLAGLHGSPAHFDKTRTTFVTGGEK